MGSGKSSTPSQATTPPPPTPTPEVDVATSAAEKALAAQSKQSYASTVDDATSTDGATKKSTSTSTLGQVAAQPQQQPRKRERAPGSMMTPGAQNMGASAVLTG